MPPLADRPTIHSIALQAGVSPMTVSRALRGERYVEAEKAKQICALARKLGYRPNPNATQLRAWRGRKAMEIREYVAVIVGKTDPEWARSWKHQGFIQGIHDRAAQFGYKVLMFWLHEPGWTVSRIANSLRTSNVRGLILFPEDYKKLSPDLLALVADRSCAVVGSQPVSHPFHFAANDDFSNAKNATRHALLNGYRRPGFAVLRKIDELIERRFSAGFRSVIEDLPVKNHVPVLLLDSFDDQAFLKWYKQYRPDVVITHNRRIAVDQWLRPMKLKVPKDVGWITLDTVPGDRQVTGLDSRSELVGTAALDLVIAQMQRDERGLPDFQKGVSIEGVWREGRTLKRMGSEATRM